MCEADNNSKFEKVLEYYVTVFNFSVNFLFGKCTIYSSVNYSPVFGTTLLETITSIHQRSLRHLMVST